MSRDPLFRGALPRTLRRPSCIDADVQVVHSTTLQSGWRKTAGSAHEIPRDSKTRSAATESLGGGPDFSKSYSKFALVENREKFPEISPTIHGPKRNFCVRTSHQSPLPPHQSPYLTLIHAQQRLPSLSQLASPVPPPLSSEGGAGPSIEGLADGPIAHRLRPSRKPAGYYKE